MGTQFLRPTNEGLNETFEWWSHSVIDKGREQRGSPSDLQRMHSVLMVQFTCMKSEKRIDWPIYDFGFKDQFSLFSSGLTFPDDEISPEWETEWRWKIELGHYLLRQLKGGTDINYIGVQQETNSDTGIIRRNRNSIHEDKFIRWKVSPKLNHQS